MPLDLESTAYRRWYETPLGAAVDADEKAVVFDLLDLKIGERVLEIGCGDGNYTRIAAERTGFAIGLDRSRPMLQAAAQRLKDNPGLRWLQGDGARLPFRDATFDLVLIVTVLCFAKDPQAIAKEAFRVLRPGGRVVLGELGRYSSWAVLRRIRGWFGSATWSRARFFTPRQLQGLLRGAGFDLGSVNGAVFYPPVRSQRVLRAVRGAEHLGRRWLPSLGAMLLVRGVRRPGGP